MAIRDMIDSLIGGRRETIATAIAGELQRQARGGASRIDIAAMASAVDSAIAENEPFPLTMDDGKEPDELNASNDG